MMLSSRWHMSILLILEIKNQGFYLQIYTTHMAPYEKEVPVKGQAAGTSMTEIVCKPQSPHSSQTASLSPLPV